MLAHTQLSIDTRQNIISILRSTPLFKEMPENVLVHFADKAQTNTAPKGKVLFLQGDSAEWFYIVERGWVKLFRDTLDGTQAVLDIVNAGVIFGEDSVFSEQTYTCSAECVEDCTYIMCPTSLLQFYLEKNQQIAFNMMRTMSQRQNIQSREIEHLNVQTAQQRIGCLLLRLCPPQQTENIVLNLPYDKNLIAARLGMKPETFSRALAKLRESTGIEITGSKVMIPSIQRITDFTCSHCSQSFDCKTVM
jgi:CRP-like cAMP-binding protein